MENRAYKFCTLVDEDGNPKLKLTGMLESYSADCVDVVGLQVKDVSGKEEIDLTPQLTDAQREYYARALLDYKVPTKNTK